MDVHSRPYRAGLSPEADLTGLLLSWREGDEEALSRLIPLVYDQLRRLAARALAGEREGHTLEPTALVHEAYLRLAAGEMPRWNDRLHFFAVASQVMRHLLVDHARGRHRAKRGHGARRLPLAAAVEISVPVDGFEPDLLALDEALTALSTFDARKARVIELRYFGGLTIEEAAQVLGVSTATVILDARLARAWLFARLQREDVPRAPH
jgi:RNA polymerase sigma factor (TIGR02999 family)